MFFFSIDNIMLFTLNLNCRNLQQTPPPQGLPLFLLRKPQVASFEGGRGWGEYKFFFFFFLEKKFFWENFLGGKIFAKNFGDSQTPSGILWGAWKWQSLGGGSCCIHFKTCRPESWFAYFLNEFFRVFFL